MTPPRLSVILPAYNAEQTLSRAIRSVLNSTLTDFELILVNDGSTDATLEQMRRAGREDPRIRLLTQSHQGVSRAHNRAVQESQAPFIARMDADDFCYPHRFQNQLQRLARGDLDGIGGLVRIVGRDGQPVPSMRRYQDWVNSNLDNTGIRAFRFVESPLVNPSVTARREVFELGCQEGPFPEDYDFWLRALEHGFTFAKLSELVLDWTDGPTRLTRSHPSYSSEAFDRCRKAHLLEGPLRSLPEGKIHLWGAGKTGKPWLRWLQSRGFEVTWVVDVSPKKIGTQIHGTPVISPEDLPASDGIPLLVAVGAPGARNQILDHLRTRNYQAGINTWFVA